MRKDDHDNGPHFRSSERLFCTNGAWFFETRESDHGPYETREEAQNELSRYVRQMSALSEVEKPPAQEMARHNGKFRDAKISDLELVDKDEPKPNTP
jgi:hypothetical protein